MDWTSGSSALFLSNPLTFLTEEIKTMKRLPLVITSVLALVLVTSIVSAPAFATPIYRVTLKGSLGPNQSKLVGPYSLNVGSTVHLVLSWTPATATLAFGVVPAASTGNIQGCTKTGGAGDCLVTIQTAGSYYLIVANRSSTATGTVNYTGYADIDLCPPCD
jgi:hypothetical protein